MDRSIYYYGREDGDSPVISSTSNFDRYVSSGNIDESTSFPDTNYAPIQSKSCTIADPPRGNFDPRGSGGFSLDFLPMEDTIPRAYPGTIDPSVAVRTSLNPMWDMYSTSLALYPDRDSSKDARLQPQYGQSLDSCAIVGYGGLLPSPLDGSHDQNGRSCRKKSSSSSGSGTNDKKRRHQFSFKDKDEKPHRPTTQLRTASHAPKRYSPSTAKGPVESPEDVKARAAHNQVEQQYRKRLNHQFEQLLAVLPQPDYDEEGEMGDRGSAKRPMEKRISKAEVLDLARRRIKVLEKELEMQKRGLASRADKAAGWTGRLGEVPVKLEGNRDQR